MNLAHYLDISGKCRQDKTFQVFFLQEAELEQTQSKNGEIIFVSSTVINAERVSKRIAHVARKLSIIRVEFVGIGIGANK